jgi:hypothetical protein
LETKRDRITAPRPKLLVSARRLQDQRPQPRKTVLDSSPGEEVFCSWETKRDRITTQRTKLLRPGDDNTNFTNQETVLGSSPIKDVGFRDDNNNNNNNFSMIFNEAYRMTRPVVIFRTIKIDKKFKHFWNFPTVTLRTLW